MGKKQKILWGCKIGDPDWAEEIITEKEDQIEKAKKWAGRNGFDRFRISEIDILIPPDFIKPINVKST